MEITSYLLSQYLVKYLKIPLIRNEPQIKFKWSCQIKLSHFPKTKVSAKIPRQEVEKREGKKGKDRNIDKGI